MSSKTLGRFTSPRMTGMVGVHRQCSRSDDQTTVALRTVGELSENQSALQSIDSLAVFIPAEKSHCLHSKQSSPDARDRAASTSPSRGSLREIAFSPVYLVDLRRYNTPHKTHLHVVLKLVILLLVLVCLLLHCVYLGGIVRTACLRGRLKARQLIAMRIEFQSVRK